MVSDKQSQSGGDESVNIQGRDITIGLSFTEARQVAMDVFNANFYRLRSIAAEVAQSRAEAFLNSYFEKVAEEGNTEIPEAENPDFQYSIFTAQKEYARTGDNDLGELLVRLLIDRTKIVERNLQQIVLNEALTVAPKLTQSQIDVLSVIFLLVYTKNNSLINIDSLRKYFDTFFIPFIPSISEKMSLYQHLEFASCGTITISSRDISDIFLKHYPALFCKGFNEEELKATGLPREKWSTLIILCLHDASLFQARGMDDETIAGLCKDVNVDDVIGDKLKILQNSKLMPISEIRDFVLQISPAMAKLFEVWDKSAMKHMNLTSVGIAIAHANIQRLTGERFDLSIWI